MPAWAFGSTLTMLAAGAFIMQMGVQGAWGIIPVHLNELSPDAVRGLLPGFTYQIGILLAASTPTVEFALRDRLGYAWALTAFELVVMAVLAVLLIFGKEQRGRSFMREREVVAACDSASAPPASPFKRIAARELRPPFTTHWYRHASGLFTVS